MFCPKCGVTNKEDSGFCTSCGGKLPTDNNKTNSTSNPHTTNQTDIPKKSIFSFDNLKTSDPLVVTPFLNTSMIIGSIIIPLIGIIMGIIYMRKDHPAEKKAGMNWLGVACTMILIHVIIRK